MLLVAVGVSLIVLRLADSPDWKIRAAANAGPSGRLISMRFSEVDSLVVERDGFRLELQRVGTQWNLVQPVTTGADSTEVMRFLDLLERAPLLDRLPLHDIRRRNLAMADFGLAPSVGRVVVQGPLFRVEIAFGASTPSGNEVYAAVDRAEDVVCVTDRRIFNAFPTSLEHWRDRTLLRKPSGKVTALEIRRPGVPFLKVVREGDLWQLVQPLSGRAATRAVGSAIEALQATRIERFIPADGETNGLVLASGVLRSRLVYYGLDNETAVQAQVWENGNPVGARIRFGREVDGSPGLVYALTPDDNSIVAVSNAVLRSLPAGVGAIRSRRLFDVSSAAVRWLTIQHADETVELNRHESGLSGLWIMKAPVQGEADGPTVEQAVAEFLALQAERLMDPDVNAAAITNEPLCRMELAFADGSTQRVSVAQSVHETGCYDLTLPPVPMVFVVAASNMPPQIIGKVGVLELVNRTILALPAQTIRRITVKGPDRQESVERKGGDGDGQWVAGAGAADAEVLKTWATLLSRWRAESVVRLGAGAQDVTAFGMAEPWLDLTVDVASDDALRRSVRVGRVAANGGRYVSVLGHDVIYLVSSNVVALLESRLTRK